MLLAQKKVFITSRIFNSIIKTMVYLIVIVLFLLIISLRQVNQYERALKFTMGRFSSILEPGWRIIIPIFQSYRKVDMRVKAVDVPDQNAITRDNISVKVNAVLYYKVESAEKAVLEVEDFMYAMSQYAQTTMRNIVGETTLDDLLSNREAIANRIREVIVTESTAWGLKVSNVELKDVSLPPDMERTIAKQAEAEREKRAVIITSEGELAASENMAKAARMLSEAPGALHLRTLQAMNDISSDQSNTVVFTLPMELLKAFEGFAKHK